MARKMVGPVSFGGSTDELLPLLALHSHQVRAAVDPSTPARVLAESAYSRETAGRPIRIWGREPWLARRINDALAAGADKLVN